MSWQEDYADDPDDESMGDDFEDLEDGDSGMVGSMMDAVLAHYEKGKCRQCDKSMEEKPAAESFCSQDCKEKWETLLKVRVEIGLHDLKTRGYD